MSTTIIDADSKNTIYTGLSTDSKPTPVFTYSGEPRISIFYETDTKDIYRHDGSSWAMVESSSRQMVSDPMLDISEGVVVGRKTVTKFGRAVAGIQTTATDIWDRADATPTQQIWLAPTAARIHTISSDSASDVSGGTGATTVVVSYLADWDTAETTETVSGDLNAGIAMSNAAVMIHRMKVAPQATSTTPNVGTIIATAATDTTITAQINPGDGQTQMAIYGIPSTQSFLMEQFYATINKSSGVVGTINFSLVVNPNPDVQTLAFLTKNTRGLQSTGQSSDDFPFNPPFKITGPAIIKLQGIASAADIEASGGFDGVVVDN